MLERTCALTVNLLRRRGLLGEALDAFIANENISPFRETQAPAFLESLSVHPDQLVACVAQFELALMKVRAGRQARVHDCMVRRARFDPALSRKGHAA